MDALISCTQALYFPLGMNNRREQVHMSQPRQVLRSASCPYPTRLWSERGSSCFRGSYGYSGLNMVCMTNNAKFLMHFTQTGSSMVMMMMSSMNPYIDASFASY